MTIPSPTLVEIAIERATDALRNCCDKGNEAWIWRMPSPRFCYLPNGSSAGWVWTIQIGLGLGGWCVGQRRILGIALPFRGDRPENPWQAPLEAVQAIDRLIAAIDMRGITLVEPVTDQPHSTIAPVNQNATAYGRAQHYNKSPARAVRLRRAAHSAQRHGYF